MPGLPPILCQLLSEGLEGIAADPTPRQAPARLPPRSRAPTDPHREIALRDMPGARAVVAHLPLSIKSFGNEGWKIKIIHQLHLLGPAGFAAYLRGKFVILLHSQARDAPAEIDAPGEETWSFPLPSLLSCFFLRGFCIPAAPKAGLGIYIQV